MRLPSKGGEYERMKKLNKGFTLIELLVVIAVLGILAAVVLVAINPTARIQDARNSGVRSDIGQVGTAIEAYFTENNGSYPAALSNLTADDQLKQLPSLPSGRDTGCAVDSYTDGYSATGGEAVQYADLEPCDGDATQVWYAYKTACGKAIEVTGSTAPDTSTTGC